MIDTHAHLDALEDPAAAVTRARDAGVTRIVTIGTDPTSWAKMLPIVEAHDDELSRLLRSYIESCRYLDELQHGGVDIGHARRADAVRDATFARDSIHRSLVKAIGVAD